MEDFDDVVDISEDIVVWEAGGDIFGADISNIDDIKVFTICSNSARQYDPSISGSLVVWTEERKGRYGYRTAAILLWSRPGDRRRYNRLANQHFRPDRCNLAGVWICRRRGTR